AVLVVAADDGVMPQTRESISHARAAEVPIVVAINKVDLPDGNPDRARNELAQEGLQPEEWGGTTQFSEVSAKAKTGLDDLLEKVLLVADAELELTANPRGERLRREQLVQQAKTGPTLETLFDQMQAGGVQDLNLVVKGDVDGSVEAAVSELQKIQHPEVRVNVIHTGVGAISENDVNLASVSNAVVVGFNVRPSAEARALAEREGVDIRSYRVIYQLTQDIEHALVGMLRPRETDEAPAAGGAQQPFG